MVVFCRQDRSYNLRARAKGMLFGLLGVFLPIILLVHFLASESSNQFLANVVDDSIVDVVRVYLVSLERAGSCIFSPGGSSFAQGLSSLLSYSIPGRGAFSLACSLPKQAPLPVSLVSFILSMFSVMIHSLYITEENGQKVPMTSNISRHRCLRNVFCACFFLLCVANHRPPRAVPCGRSLASHTAGFPCVCARRICSSLPHPYHHGTLLVKVCEISSSTSAH